MAEGSYSYVVRVGSKDYNVMVKPMGANRFKVIVEDSEFDVSVESGSPTVKVSGPRQPQASAKASSGSGTGNSSKRSEPAVTGTGTVSPAATTPAPTPAAPVGAAIASPIPGKVMKVLVSPGDTVSPGKLVATLESMKMEVQVFSDKSGRVREVKTRPGDFVNVGDVLIVLE